ncbi:hypothetical protein [Nonomuraea sp. KM88]|uniref:hypothetical protein n=1 Tax=Nonomuraea sp. KM88 TaxID=3457427 RepID=UPI003FCD4429
MPDYGFGSLSVTAGVVARAHQTLVWERTRHILRLRSALRDYFPAALASNAVLALLAKAPPRPPSRSRPSARSSGVITGISSPHAAIGAYPAHPPAPPCSTSRSQRDLGWVCRRQ